MASVDLTPIIEPIMALIGATITGLIAVYVPRALNAFEKRTGIQLTENQRKTVQDAVGTAAGMLETDLDKGALRVAHINVNNPEIQRQAQAVINAVPQSAAALGMTVDGVARMIVGATDTRVPPVLALAPTINNMFGAAGAPIGAMGTVDTTVMPTQKRDGTGVPGTHEPVIESAGEASQTVSVRTPATTPAAKASQGAQPMRQG